MYVLGIETSCDETSAAIVHSDRRILAHTVFSQVTTHAAYGGVIPEVAARAHLDAIDYILTTTLSASGLTCKDLDGIAATGGPGLIGGVIVGTMVAKTLAAYHRKPYIAVNHLEGHALTVRLTEDVEFPYLLLLVSGGHSQLLIVHGVGHYELLGGTRDDAVGEAFDKTAKLLGLGYPGGPAVEAAAQRGDPKHFDLPRPLLHDSTLDFSFSGLKTAVLQTVQGLGHAPLPQEISDIAASFQAAVADVLATKCAAALARRTATTLVVGGGVAANQTIRSALMTIATASGVGFVAPPLNLCTDNGAMIAWAGLERLRLGLTDALDFAPRPRWPLTTLGDRS